MSRQLLYKDGQISEDKFYNVGNHLPSDCLLVYNNTRVIQARLVFHKASGARIEIFCLEPIDPRSYELSLCSRSTCVWRCMIGNLKKWKGGALSMEMDVEGKSKLELCAERISSDGDTHFVRFSWAENEISFGEILSLVGELPIPPYLNRETEESDKRRYQTVYSKIEGSVAAPTAGLHFTEDVLSDLRRRGIDMTEVTLHVGAGTFQPVKTADANKHVMHHEIISVSRKSIEKIRDNIGKICAVGTTSMRTLESLYFIGCKIHEYLSQKDVPLKSEIDLSVGQTEPYIKDYGLSAVESMDCILQYMSKTGKDELHGDTQIMIRPGYEFKIVDMLITNFHQPKSTLLLLVSAFIGDDWRKVYDYALNNGFRFLSYGDSSLLYRRERN